MKTANNLLHTQLVELFEQHPYTSCFSHNEEGIYFLQEDSSLHVNYDQVETIATALDKAVITLCNEVIYTIVLSQDRVEITLPVIKE